MYRRLPNKAVYMKQSFTSPKTLFIRRGRSIQNSRGSEPLCLAYLDIWKVHRQKVTNRHTKRLLNTYYILWIFVYSSIPFFANSDNWALFVLWSSIRIFPEEGSFRILEILEVGAIIWPKKKVFHMKFLPFMFSVCYQSTNDSPSFLCVTVKQMLV